MTTYFNWLDYLDDRMYVLHLCKWTLKADPDWMIITNFYPYWEPEELNTLWILATFYNVKWYKLQGVIHFESKEDAIDYIENTEPYTPLISLWGKSPKSPLLYSDYIKWKKKNNYKDYDYQLLKNVWLDRKSMCETVYQTRDQFKWIYRKRR